jgi:hypothetical protein
MGGGEERKRKKGGKGREEKGKGRGKGRRKRRGVSGSKSLPDGCFGGNPLLLEKSLQP